MLFISRVPRSLEKKTKLYGFELPDLLFIFLYLAVSNLIFGQTNLKPLLVWGGTAAIAAALYFVKRGKPDSYLQHYGEYAVSPSVFSAAAPDLHCRPLILNRQAEDKYEESKAQNI